MTEQFFQQFSNEQPKINRRPWNAYEQCTFRKSRTPPSDSHSLTNQMALQCSLAIMQPRVLQFTIMWLSATCQQFAELPWPWVWSEKLEHAIPLRTSRDHTFCRDERPSKSVSMHSMDSSFSCLTWLIPFNFCTLTMPGYFSCFILFWTRSSHFAFQSSTCVNLTPHFQCFSSLQFAIFPAPITIMNGWWHGLSAPCERPITSWKRAHIKLISSFAIDQENRPISIKFNHLRHRYMNRI